MRDRFQLIILFAFTSVLVMGFRPTEQNEVLHLIGRTEGLPIALKKALTPGDDFAPIPAPKPGYWLAEHHEPGQTFEDFVKVDPIKPDKLRDKIYLQPLDDFSKGRSPQIETLAEYAAAYFGMDVRIVPPLQTNRANITTRVNPYSGNRQLLTTDILELLVRRMPSDAFCMMAITMEDLYPHPSWNFVFGQASAQDRVGVFSFARYDPAFYGEERGENYQELLLRRSCKVLVHETAHMFSLAHCIFFNCVMNGSNHLQESDVRPMHLCPVCLRKLQFGIGLDVVDRYRKLCIFYETVGFAHEARWVSNRLKRILDDGDR
jgi:archaemetzincin